MIEGSLNLNLSLHPLTGQGDVRKRPLEGNVGARLGAGLGLEHLGIAAGPKSNSRQAVRRSEVPPPLSVFRHRPILPARSAFGDVHHMVQGDCPGQPDALHD